MVLEARVLLLIVLLLIVLQLRLLQLRVLQLTVLQFGAIRPAVRDFAYANCGFVARALSTDYYKENQLDNLYIKR
jgi:hypothetical protein